MRQNKYLIFFTAFIALSLCAEFSLVDNTGLAESVAGDICLTNDPVGPCSHREGGSDITAIKGALNMFYQNCALKLVEACLDKGGWPGAMNPDDNQICKFTPVNIHGLGTWNCKAEMDCWKPCSRNVT